MIIYVGNYWIDGALLATIAMFAVIIGLLIWYTRRQRARKAALAATMGKTAATPIRSGLRGGR